MTPEERDALAAKLFPKFGDYIDEYAVDDIRAFVQRLGPLAEAVSLYEKEYRAQIEPEKKSSEPLPTPEEVASEALHRFTSQSLGERRYARVDDAIAEAIREDRARRA